MLSIDKLKGLIQNDEKVFVTEHAAVRLRIRGIRYDDIISSIRSGEIIEVYPDNSVLLCYYTNIPKLYYAKCSKEQNSEI